MTEGAIQVIHDLVETPSFLEAMDEFITFECAERVEELRAAVRDNDIPRAQQIEGELEILEHLLGLLVKHGQKFNRP